MAKIVTKEYKATEIDNAIGGVEKSAKTLQQAIHNIGVAILREWQAKSAPKSVSDADAMKVAKWACERLNKLQNASPYHRRAFSVWVGLFTGLEWNDEKKEWFVHVTKARLMGKTYTEARNNPFWKVKPAPSAEPFNLDLLIDKQIDAMENLLKRAQKRQEKSQDGDNIDTARFRQIRAAMRTLKGEDTAAQTH